MKVNDGAFHNILFPAGIFLGTQTKELIELELLFFAILHCSICYGRRSLELKETKPGSWI